MAQDPADTGSGPPRARRRGRRPKGASQPSDVLSCLSSDEAKRVLAMLLDEQPDLAPVAQRIATSVIGGISVDDVAADVGAALSLLDSSDLNRRTDLPAGRYSHPVDAAWELVEETIQPWLDEMIRNRRVGLVEAAETICRGVALALFRVDPDDHRNEVLAWVPDAPEEFARSTFERLLKATPENDRGDTYERLEAQLAGDGIDWWQ